MRMARYRFWRWLAPKLPGRKLRVWVWDHKWRLWFMLYESHINLWSAE